MTECVESTIPAKPHLQQSTVVHLSLIKYTILCVRATVQLSIDAGKKFFVELYDDSVAVVRIQLV